AAAAPTRKHLKGSECKPILIATYRSTPVAASTVGRSAPSSAHSATSRPTSHPGPTHSPAGACGSRHVTNRSRGAGGPRGAEAAGGDAGPGLAAAAAFL